MSSPPPLPPPPRPIAVRMLLSQREVEGLRASSLLAGSYRWEGEEEKSR